MNTENFNYEGIVDDLTLKGELAPSCVILFLIDVQVNQAEQTLLASIKWVVLTEKRLILLAGSGSCWF